LTRKNDPRSDERPKKPLKDLLPAKGGSVRGGGTQINHNETLAGAT
jgi:hypothetical protein